jgi:plastocyanin
MNRRAARWLLAVAFVVALGVAWPWVAFAATQTVTIQDFNFSPPSVTVNAGDSVTWRNTGGEGHTATSNTGAFDTGVLNPGASKTIVFGIAGTFDYHCAIHVTMRGTVTVLAAVATTPPPTPPPTIAPTPPRTIAPTAPPTVAPTTPAPTAAPTSAPTPTVAPASSAPATVLASVAPTATAVAVASPTATTSPPAPSAAPAGDPGPLPFIAGGVVVAVIAGAALYAIRRR